MFKFFIVRMSRFVPFCPAPKNVLFKKMPERRTKRDKTGRCTPPPPPPPPPPRGSQGEKVREKKSGRGSQGEEVREKESAREAGRESQVQGVIERKSGRGSQGEIVRASEAGSQGKESQ